MELSNLTYDDLVTVTREIRRLAEAAPDYVYPVYRDSVAARPVCVYTPSGGSSRETVVNPPTRFARCIVGQALANVGAGRKLSRFEGRGAYELLSTGHNALNGNGQRAYALRSWAAAIQSAQDGGIPWGKALARADGDYPSVKEIHAS